MVRGTNAKVEVSCDGEWHQIEKSTLLEMLTQHLSVFYEDLVERLREVGAVDERPVRRRLKDHMGHYLTIECQTHLCRTVLWCSSCDIIVLTEREG